MRLPDADAIREIPGEEETAQLILLEMAKCRKAIAIEARKEGFPIYPDLLGH